MATGTPRKQHLRIQEESQMDLESDLYGRNQGDDYDGKLREAQQQLEVLQMQREELERQKSKLDTLNRRKEEFLHGQVELTERFATSITSIDRELFELRQELDDLEQTRQSFRTYLDRIEKIEPEGWPREELEAELERSLLVLDKAEEEFESAVAAFSGSRSHNIFGPTAPRGAARSDDFRTTMKNGLAFHMPLVVLGAIALILYLIK